MRFIRRRLEDVRLEIRFLHGFNAGGMRLSTVTETGEMESQTTMSACVRNFSRTVLLLLLWTPGMTQAKDRTTTVWLDDLDLGEMSTGWGLPLARKACTGRPLRIADKTFERGVGTHAVSVLNVEVDGRAKAFDAAVGADAGATEQTSVRFVVMGDGKTLAESPVLKVGDAAYLLHADLTGVRKVRLVVEDAGDGIAFDQADWCDACFAMTDGARPVPAPEITDLLGILSPAPDERPRINGPRILGARPGHPILFRLPVSGERPMRLAAERLPEGLSFDPEPGVLRGRLSARGDYAVRFVAENRLGRAESELILRIGDKIALTPPMGWNSWNCFAHTVTDRNVRDAARALETSGLVNHGWNHVNIDDFWQNRVGETDDDTLKGPMRQADGTIAVNRRFPDMKALVDDIHARGLKVGLYSSPGPTTCGGCTGSWKHEWTDARTYARWGFDYLKYDWCGYKDVSDSVASGFHAFVLPYRLMGEALAAQDRDILFSICQQGRGNVFTWGANVGGQCWRTTEDITDTWTSVGTILMAQADLWPFARPGEWNDPDMLVVGRLGWGSLHPTRLKTNEQYTHMSFWCILCSPLLIGCDLTALDDFTMALLTNDEVLETNQDALGAQAARVAGCEFAEVWVKPMSDGSFVFALFNKSSEVREVAADLSGLGVEGEWRVRDLWRRRDIGIWSKRLPMKVHPHATELLRLFPVDADSRLQPGLRDVRDNSTYRQFKLARPVDKPGYVGASTDRSCRICHKGRTYK